MGRIKIFDTTLRDGEQSPGCSMNLAEKLEVARQLERLKVDVIEAGFAISSPGDFESVKSIAETVHDCTVASLARCTVGDIDAAWNAVKVAADPRIHVFLATSPIHMQYKLRMTPEQVIDRVDQMVRYAKAYCPNIEFSCEDATRSDPEFLKVVIDKAIKAGATVINVPDTVGYTTPTEMRDLIAYLIKNVPDSDKVEYSVHCHNDLGMAVANALGGVQGGALQIECTVNGIGERAGNTSLEEVVMAMRTRPNLYGELPRIDTKQIYRSSNLVYNIIGQTAPHNKPIVGANAFAHESGIHQHGVLANKTTYEILTPESVGVATNSIILGKHSGKHAFASRLSEMGYTLDDEQITAAFTKFKDLCDKKKNVTDSDIEALVNNTAAAPAEQKYRFISFKVATKGKTGVEGTICLRHENQFIEKTYCGDGSIDSLYAAIDQIIDVPDHVLEKFAINAVSEGRETLGEVTLKIRCKDEIYSGHGLSTDILEAAIIAYLDAVNRIME